MKHYAQWDERGFLSVAIVGTFEPDEAAELSRQMHAIMDGKSPRLMLFNHSKASKMVSRETRAELQKMSSTLDWDKAAIHSISHLNRMLARLITKVLGVNETTQFFETEAQAIDWLLTSSERATQPEQPDQASA